MRDAGDARMTLTACVITTNGTIKVGNEQAQVAFSMEFFPFGNNFCLTCIKLRFKNNMMEDNECHSENVIPILITLSVVRISTSAGHSTEGAGASSPTPQEMSEYDRQMSGGR